MKAWFRVVAACVVAALSSAPARSQEKVVSIGYIPVAAPWLHAIGTDAFERATGHPIHWIRFETGAHAIQALADGKVQIAYSGSTGIAVGMSANVPMELFWIGADTDSSEALVVHTSSRVTEPKHLRGKRIGVPFWSTTHFHLLFALDQFSIPESEVAIFNKSPKEIVASWKKGELDAAFLWYPEMGELLLSGRILLWSGWLNRWGRPTFDGLVVRRDFGDANPEFMTRFVHAYDEANRSFTSNTGKWDSHSPEVQAIVKLIGTHTNVVGEMSLIKLPSLDEQASIDWLGGGGDGGAAKALLATAQFLQRGGLIRDAQRDYSSFVTTKWVTAAADYKKQSAGQQPGDPRR